MIDETTTVPMNLRQYLKDWDARNELALRVARLENTILRHQFTTKLRVRKRKPYIRHKKANTLKAWAILN